MKHLIKKSITSIIFILLAFSNTCYSQENEYTQRFLEMYKKIYDPANGYFSKDGVPYHSIETLIAEAPDHGHETTSEAYSYWIWLDAMYGGITKDWKPLNNSWAIMEKYAIPTADMQPTTKDYSPTKAATYAGEWELPSMYPSPLETSVPVGIDPVSPDLTTTYGSDIYGMHWLFDCDNFFGYGNKGDGVSTPSYMNTFQRGVEESVWKTVPHPSWEAFKWGNDDGTGFLTMYVKDTNTPAPQWRYTNAPDADARVVQAMYWASEFVKAQGGTPKTVIPLDKALKMGDFVRLSFFDKYFKPIGVQSKTAPGATGYESAHYLVSWYYAWGGPIQSAGWAWRMGCSHNHFGYQNPVAAYALGKVADMKPKSTNGARDWAKSYDRQLEFYTWLQSAEGGIAGGATNSYNGRYEKYPVGSSTFYDMVYEPQPVYHDPGSNDWFGMQAWSMERVAEVYYINNDPRAKALLDKWVPWVISHVKLLSNGDFQIPATLKWTGQPETWNPTAPKANTGLHVEVLKYGTDLGIAGCLAKALSYYAAATEKYSTLNVPAKTTAKEILDRMWNIYYEPVGQGVAAIEERGDFKNFFEAEAYVPVGWTGKMPNGDIIKNGNKFIDIRSDYRKDKAFPALEAAYKAGEPFKSKYHRFWGQADIALAYAEFGRLFKHTINTNPIPATGMYITETAATLELTKTLTLKAAVVPFNAANKNYTWSTSDNTVATVVNGVVTPIKVGTATITATAADGGFKGNCLVTVVPKIIVPTYTVTTSKTGTGSITLSPAGPSFEQGTSVTATITPANGWKITDVKVDGASVGVVSTYRISSISKNTTISATFVEGPPCTLLLVHEVPRTTALPSVNTEFAYKTVRGTGGPSLSNVTKLQINWDLPNKGLYSFALNTNDGKPDYYVSLISKTTHTFGDASPAVKITGSGITGLDGDYWVNIHNGNFAMVSKTGTYSIYFAKTNATAPDCIPTHFEEFESSSKEITIVPNPVRSNGTFTVNLSDFSSGEISVLDMQGAVRTKQYFAEQKEVNIDCSLANGIYIVKVVIDNKVITKKIVVR